MFGLLHLKSIQQRYAKGIVAKVAYVGTAFTPMVLVRGRYVYRTATHQANRDGVKALGGVIKPRCRAAAAISLLNPR